jgi:hypothetical protein
MKFPYSHVRNGIGPNAATQRVLNKLLIEANKYCGLECHSLKISLVLYNDVN